MKIADKIKTNKIKKEIRSLGTPERALSSLWFFKTGKGEYGEGDVFLGLTMGEQRNIAKKYLELTLPEIELLLHSKEHEFRMTALLVLVGQYKNFSKEKRKIYNFYLKNTKWINNWDLVDVSAHHIVGEYLEEKFRSHNNSDREKEKMEVLSKLANSKSLWERRIAIVSTFAFIKKGQYEETILVAKILINDKHDLIHKAVGWMLREVGKRASLSVLEDFLQKNITKMPRTMLRYAIEHFPQSERLAYLKMKNQKT